MSEQFVPTTKIDISPLRVLLERIEETYRPLQVWLFGSRARGEARLYSDWDLLVVVPDETSEALFDPSVSWEVQKDLTICADVIPYPVSGFLDGWGVVNSLPYEINRDGVLLYESRSIDREFSQALPRKSGGGLALGGAR